MFNEEKNIVNETFLKNKNVYNICIGGAGGDKFKYLNDKDKKHFLKKMSSINKKRANKLDTKKRFTEMMKEKWKSDKIFIDKMKQRSIRKYNNKMKYYSNYENRLKTINYVIDKYIKNVHFELRKIIIFEYIDKLNIIWDSMIFRSNMRSYLGIKNGTCNSKSLIYWINRGWDENMYNKLIKMI